MNSFKGCLYGMGVQDVGVNNLCSRPNPGLKVGGVPGCAADILTCCLQQREQTAADITAGADDEDEPVF